MQRSVALSTLTLLGKLRAVSFPYFRKTSLITSPLGDFGRQTFYQHEVRFIYSETKTIGLFCSYAASREPDFFLVAWMFCVINSHILFYLFYIFLFLRCNLRSDVKVSSKEAYHYNV